MSTFILHALPAGEVDTDAPVTVRKTASDREPCRRCLRDAAPGERLALTAYDPFLVRSPYAGDGPVFVHADGCEPFPSEPGVVSEQVTRRVLSVRAYDADAMLTDATVLAGEQFRERAEALLADPEVEFLHVHFAGPGCFAFRAPRRSGRPASRRPARARSRRAARASAAAGRRRGRTRGTARAGAT
jgi:hypothetical protein